MHPRIVDEHETGFDMAQSDVVCLPAGRRKRARLFTHVIHISQMSSKSATANSLDSVLMDSIYRGGRTGGRHVLEARRPPRRAS